MSEERLPEAHPAIRALLDHCPDLQSRFESERADRMDDDPDNQLPYMQAAALAEVVIQAYGSGARDCLPGLFGQLEALLTSGAESDRDLLVVGFIEDLQGAIGWAGLDANDLYAMLGPQGRAAWDELVRSWKRVNDAKAAGELPGSSDPMPDVSDPQLRRIMRGIYRPPE